MNRIDVHGPYAVEEDGGRWIITNLETGARVARLEGSESMRGVAHLMAERLNRKARGAED
jgi:hypothetical protein